MGTTVDDLIGLKDYAVETLTSIAGDEHVPASVRQFARNVVERALVYDAAESAEDIVSVEQYEERQAALPNSERRLWLDRLLSLHGRARDCEIPEAPARYALMEADKGSADNGGPWWEFDEDWNYLANAAANQEHPEDWPPTLLVDLDSGEQWTCELTYRTRVVGKPDPNDPNLALWFTPDAIRQHYDALDDDSAKWVEDATDEQLAAIGQDCLGHDSLYREFHEALEYEVEQSIKEAKPGEAF